LRGTKDEYSRICSNHAGSSSATEHFVVYNDEQLREHIERLEYVVIESSDHFPQSSDYRVAESGSDIAGGSDRDGRTDGLTESTGSADFD
jgi:mevalonate kinase